MSDLNNDTAKSGTKPAYSPPRVVRLGDLNDGIGACSTGSGFVAPTECKGGNNVSGNCDANGNAASGSCMYEGYYPTNYCYSGNWAGIDCLAGAFAAGNCSGGADIGN